MRYTSRKDTRQGSVYAPWVDRDPHRPRCRRARDVRAVHAGGSRWQRQLAVLGALEGLLFAVGTGFAGLVALFWLGLKCDESCTEPGSPTDLAGEWWHTLDAWQWEAQAALAFGAFLAAVATIVLPLVRRYHVAIAVAVVGLAAFCAWALMMAPLGEQFGI
jgi:hypothetical protein